MKISLRRHTRLFPPIAALVLGSACILEAAAGPTPTSQVIVVPGDGGGETQESGAVSPTPQTPLGLTPTWTLAAEPSATTTVAIVTMIAGQDLSCVAGPHWILYEWVARIEEGEVVTLLAKAPPEWEEYYFVLKTSGVQVSCWAFGGSSTIHGDPSMLPIREAPPLPQVAYRIENQTGLRVCNVYIRGKDETAWGADRLGEGGHINPGTSLDLTMTAGFYDVLIQECKENAVMYEAHDRAIGSEQGYRYTLLNNQVDLFVYNDTAENMCGLSYKPSNESTWRVLHSIEDGILAPGEGVSVRLVVGYYDFRYARCSGPVSTASGNAILPGQTRFPDTDA